jgi:hypothetical protein
LKLANRELGTVEGIGQDGRMSLKMDGGRPGDRVVELDPAKHPHLDHGYAVTSYSSQGQTADRVLIHADTELGAKDLLNNRMAYVAVSRGAYDAQIFTNDREKLGAALGHDVSHSSAHVPEMKQEQIAKAPEREVDFLTNAMHFTVNGKAFKVQQVTGTLANLETPTAKTHSLQFQLQNPDAKDRFLDALGKALA